MLDVPQYAKSDNKTDNIDSFFLYEKCNNHKNTHCMTPMQRNSEIDSNRHTSTKSHEKAVQGQDAGALITCRYPRVAPRMSWEREECLISDTLIYCLYSTL